MEPLIAGALLFCNPAQPGPYPPAGSVVDAWIAAYNAGDAEGAAGLITSDAEVEWGGKTFVGQDLVKRLRDKVFRLKPAEHAEVIDRQDSENGAILQAENITRAGWRSRRLLVFYAVEHGCIVSLASGPLQD